MIPSDVCDHDLKQLCGAEFSCSFPLPQGRAPKFPYFLILTLGFTSKTAGIEITDTILDDTCKVIEIKTSQPMDWVSY